MAARILETGSKTGLWLEPVSKPSPPLENALHDRTRSIGNKVLKLDLARFVATSLLLFLISPSSLAHNGSVVTTSVVSGVTVDGDPSDWPADLPWHSVGLNLYGDPESTDTDCSARFRIAVDETDVKVYALVEIRDDSFVPPPKGYKDWTSNDAVDVFLAVPNANQTKKKEGSTQAGLNSVSANRYDTQNKTFVHECSFDLRDAEFVDLKQSISAALTVSYSDKDEDGSFTVKFWSPEINKAVHLSRRGDLVVCGSRRGLVKGKLTREPGLDEVGRLMLNFQSMEHPLLNIDLRTEPGGAYQLVLPPGRYQRTGLHLPAVSLEVRDGETTLDSIEYPAQQPKRFLLHDFGSHPRANPDFSPQLRRHGKPTWTTTQSQPYEVNKLSGLPDSRITALAQDSNGALWVGTAGNLASFNGACLEVYQKDLAHNNRRLWLDRKRERLWLAGRHAVGYIADGYLTKFPLLDEYRSVCVGPTHDGRVCIGTKAGLFFWNDEHFQFQGRADGLPDEFIKAVLSDPDRGVTWIGTNQGLVAFNGQSYQLYDQHGLDDVRIASLFLDSRGRLWVGTASSLYYFENDQFQLVRKHKTEQIEYARSFVEFDNGAIKVGAYNEFLDIPADFPKSPFTIQPESAPCNAMLLQDKQLWMGFGDGELRREDQALRKPYSIARGACSYLYSIGDHVWFIEETPSIGEAERKWAAVRLNKATYKTTRFPITVPAQDLKGNPLEVKIFYVSKNGVWVGTKAHGVFELRGKDWVALPLPTEQFAEVASMTEDTQKRLWIATLREVFRKQNDKVTRIKLPTMPASTQLLHVGRTPKGRQVLGTTEGVFVLNDKMEILERLHESTGMLSNVPRAMRYGRDGTLWLATFSGLQSIKGDKSVVYNAETGMLDDRPGSFLTIWDDEVWCGSHSGINRISVSSGIVQHLLGNDGLGENKIFSASADGDSMWLAGETGVWQYRRGTTPPQLSIDDTFTTRSLGPRSKLSVTTDLTAIQVKLKATSLRTRAGGMIYQYRIGDGEWKRTRPDSRVEVPAAGKHHVQFRAIDRDQLISNTQQLSLTVNPPYARWLTNLALIMGTMGLAECWD